MIDKNDLLASMVQDCKVSQHLFTKIPEGALDYRPTPQQRSTTELLRYLSICGVAGATCMARQTWDPFKEFSARAEAMSAAEFPSAMDLQIAELEELFESLSEDDLKTVQTKVPGGGPAPLGLGILLGPGKWLTAYRMQLFLYAKAAGNADIGTANAWAGVDPKKKQ